MIVLREDAAVQPFDAFTLERECPACEYAGNNDVEWGYPHIMPSGGAGALLRTQQEYPVLGVTCARCGYQIAVMKPANAES